MLNDSQMKQVVFEAFHKFVEDKYKEYSKKFRKEYVEEVEQWTCFDMYVHQMSDVDIDEILHKWIEEPTREDDRMFRRVVSGECDKVININANTIFATPEIARIMIGA